MTTTPVTGYSHTQYASIKWVLLALAVPAAASAWAFRDDTAMLLGLGGFALVMTLLASMFAHLTVRDDGDVLRLQFGWLPVFGRNVEYSRITSVRRTRSSFIDGWGIHYIPGRGWTWNLWGYDCVEVTLDGRLLRIGSDDADGLAAFLHARVGDST